VIRILLADDQALIRSGIRSLLEAEDDIEVVAEACDGQQAIALAAEHRPDIALIDIQMPVLDGIEATRQIVADERLDSVRVVILTNYGLDEYIFRALRAGASGFLLKDTDPAGLLQALRVVMRGDALLSPAVTRRLIGEFVARPPDAVAAAGMETLTRREREVVALVAHGLSNDEIADAMVLSPSTAKTHVSRAMIKLGAHDRAQLVVFAYQTGLVTPRAAGLRVCLTCLSGLRVFRAVLKALPRHLADAAAFVFRRGLPGIIKIGWRQQAVGQQEVGEITSVTAFFPDEALQQLLIVGHGALSAQVQGDDHVHHRHRLRGGQAQDVLLVVKSHGQARGRVALEVTAHPGDRVLAGLADAPDDRPGLGGRALIAVTVRGGVGRRRGVEPQP
jgi:DNA-binding NarL/FixJ family response regulator